MNVPDMWHEGKTKAALGRAPGGEVVRFELDARPLVRVRAIYGRAVAYTPTHVLVEWYRVWGEWFLRWEPNWQVHRVTAEEWRGDPFP
ncbi:hypothetical protein GALAXY_29 [Arthrobacter phage Galaxy]|uniref:Uncharacterized protein n=1 Tax=Arthrobacter phage Galaxy TaxID=1772326 RepID=A0A0U3TIU0_9CAUD|nr:hypothetical protein FDG93_gp29 [Arthrobacter phage Galaxy]ALY08873.1 hypothetical protein GALAXY_29 [Arthrobacter phage Galaxy]